MYTKAFKNYTKTLIGKYLVNKYSNNYSKIKEIIIHANNNVTVITSKLENNQDNVSLCTLRRLHDISEGVDDMFCIITNINLYNLLYK